MGRGLRTGVGTSLEEGGGLRQKMRAMGLRRYGPPEVLEALEVGRPEPGPEGVLIRVAAAGVNPADCLLRSGGLRFLARQKMPFVPGADVAGVVEAVGPGATRFGVGDPVYAMLPNTAGGGYAEYAVAAEGAVAPIPPGLTFGEAAGVPLAALTALQALRDEAALAAGARVLVNGASGGVGTFAVQISRAMGAQVTGTASGRNADLVRGLGADEVQDYTQEDITSGRGTLRRGLRRGQRPDVPEDPPGSPSERRVRHREPFHRAPLAGVVDALQGRPADQILSREA
jgi:alcohol dehydrogenase